jgi:hypothetical protein
VAIALNESADYYPQSNSDCMSYSPQGLRALRSSSDNIYIGTLVSAEDVIASNRPHLECRMRLARLAAVGLAIGVIAGFAVALLRPHPSTKTPTEAGLAAGGSQPADPALQKDNAVVDVRSTGKVTG